MSDTWFLVVVAITTILYALVRIYERRHHIFAETVILAETADIPHVVYVVHIGSLSCPYGKPYYISLDKQKAIHAIESYVKVHKGEEYRFKRETDDLYFMPDGYLSGEDKRDIPVEGHILQVPLDEWTKKSIRPDVSWDSFADLK
jgi:hypothetical protein